MTFRYFILSSIMLLMSCGDTGPYSPTDTAPQLTGDWYIPLGNYNYSYDYFFRNDTSSFEFQDQFVSVNVGPYLDQDYLYGFSNSETGILLTHITTPAEKSGTYYSGYYDKDTVVLVDTLHLFIPQFPQKGESWNLWNDHIMEVISTDTTIMTKLKGEDQFSDLNSHQVVVYREYWDQSEIYHFYKVNVGLIAQQRNYNGHLISWGELTSWH